MNYHDGDGNPCTLDRLCELEPAWAASRLRSHLAAGAALREEVQTLRLEVIHLRADRDALRTEVKALEASMAGIAVALSGECARLQDERDTALATVDRVRAWLVSPGMQVPSEVVDEMLEAPGKARPCGTT